MGLYTGSMTISRRPQPCLSGSEGCAPTSTLFALRQADGLVHDREVSDRVHVQSELTTLSNAGEDSRSVETAGHIREVYRLHESFIVALETGDKQSLQHSEVADKTYDLVEGKSLSKR